MFLRVMVGAVGVVCSVMEGLGTMAMMTRMAAIMMSLSVIMRLPESMMTRMTAIVMSLSAIVVRLPEAMVTVHVAVMGSLLSLWSHTTTATATTDTIAARAEHLCAPIRATHLHKRGCATLIVADHVLFMTWGVSPLLKHSFPRVATGAPHGDIFRHDTTAEGGVRERAPRTHGTGPLLTAGKHGGGVLVRGQALLLAVPVGGCPCIVGGRGEGAGEKGCRG